MGLLYIAADSLLTLPDVQSNLCTGRRTFSCYAYDAACVAVLCPTLMLKEGSAFYFQRLRPSRLWTQCQKPFITNALQVGDTKPVRIQITHKTEFGEEICEALVDLSMINVF